MARAGLDIVGDSPASPTGRDRGPTGIDPPPLSPSELSRWAWRRLTSMRTALVLLLLLALAAIPGSLVPQRDIDAFAVVTWKEANPSLAGPFEALGMFSVYTSVWFSAVYLLLVVSLVGCIGPRLSQYVRELRRRPPRAPRRLERLPATSSITAGFSADENLSRATTWLRAAGYRVEQRGSEISAERGFLREAGNLVFHLSILVVLFAFTIGKMFGYTAAVSIVSGDGIANTVGQYDNLVSGAFFTPDQLDEFTVEVEDFEAEFLTSGPQAGQPSSFEAVLATTSIETTGAVTTRKQVRVNDPLQVGDTSLFLVGHGYAPRLTVRDSTGTVVVDGPTVFLPEDASFRSFGVVKAPDAQPQDLAFDGQFYPTYVFTMETGPFSVFPQPDNPRVSLLAKQGDLGLDSGVPQSVFSLPESGLQPVLDDDGDPLRLDLAVGETAQLPNGAGSVTFEGVERFVRLQISQSPGDTVALGGIVVGLVGLLASLYVRPRRLFVRAGGHGTVTVAGMDLKRGNRAAADVGRLVDHLKGNAP